MNKEQKLVKDPKALRIGSVVLSYDSLIGKKCKRKGSIGVWEIWACDADGVQIMNYSQHRNLSRCVKLDTFSKMWDIV